MAPLDSKAIDCPSGDHRGPVPKSVNCHGVPPSLPIRKIPPPPREEKKAIVLPACYHDGSISSSGPKVSRTGCPPSSDFLNRSIDPSL